MLVTAAGLYDVFTVTTTEGMALSVIHHGPGTATSYPAGTPVISVQLTNLAYSPATLVLRQYDGESSDLPLVDDVVGMEVRYFGDVRPPLWPKPPAGESNCLYGSDGAYRGALMPVLDAPGGLAGLAAEAFTDGPWCGSGATRYDADLLRVRRVRVSLRLQAGDTAARGADGRFRNPGTARHSAAMAPDVTVTVDVAPRNLLQGW